MKSKQIQKFLTIGFLLMVFSTQLFAQTGKVAGKVTDKETGETLIGLTVGVDGTTKGTITDIEGRYTLQGLAPGKYTINFRYLGYQTKSITGVEVKAGAVVTLNAVMETAVNQSLKEVVVTATYRQETVGALYAQQKNAVAISNGISADVIKKSPDRNTGEVLKRISGASVQDNKFVIIRGLNDRYNTALINNSPLPSSEPDRKAFSFDIIPAALIDNIIVNKTATADLPGDFAGGATQLQTKDFPDKRLMEISYGVGFNTISTFKDFYGHSRSASDYLGFGANKYQMPSSFPGTREEFVNLPLEQQVSLGKQFENTWGINRLGTSLPSQSLQFTYGNSYQLKNEKKFGFIAALTYRTAETISDEIRNDFNEPNAEGVRVPLFLYKDDYYTFNSTIGGVANFAYISGNNKFNFKNLVNRTFDDTYMRRSGIYDQVVERRVSQQEILEKTTLNSVFEGDHILNDETKSKLNWNVSYSNFVQDQPDLRRFFYSRTAASDPFEASVPTPASASTAGRFFGYLDEYILGAAANYTMPFNWLDKQQTFKAGLVKQYKQRDFSARVLGYVNPTGNNPLLQLPQDQIFSEENIAIDKFRLDDITNPSNKYDASGDLNAAYAMVNTNLLEKLKATVGLRVENYHEILNSNDNTKDVTVDNNYLDILPSLNLTYELSPRTNARFSYSKTVARAQFRELAPFPFYDFVTGNVLTGNLELERTQIDNLDLRYEFYPSNGQTLSLSAFYKHFEKPIEFTVVPGSTAASKGLTYINAPSANLYGIELEIRHDLSFIGAGDFYKNLTLSTNASFMKSAVSFENAVLINDDRPMQGQSPYLINAGIQYASESGWQSSLLYNRIGRRISVVGFGQYTTVNGNREFQDNYPDIYEAPRDILDFQISKSFLKKKAELKLNVSNIFDADANFYQDVDKSKSYESANDQLINNVNYGRSFSLSFGYKF